MFDPRHVFAWREKVKRVTFNGHGQTLTHLIVKGLTENSIFGINFRQKKQFSNVFFFVICWVI